MLCPIKVNSNTIELAVHSSCYCVLDLLCVILDGLITVCFTYLFGRDVSFLKKELLLIQLRYQMTEISQRNLPLLVFNEANCRKK